MLRKAKGLTLWLPFPKPFPLPQAGRALLVLPGSLEAEQGIEREARVHTELGKVEQYGDLRRMPAAAQSGSPASLYQSFQNLKVNGLGPLVGSHWSQ